MIEVYMGLRPSTSLPTNMLYNTVPTQGSLKMILLSICKDKWFKTVIKDAAYIHTKTILILLI